MKYLRSMALDLGRSFVKTDFANSFGKTFEQFGSLVNYFDEKACSQVTDAMIERYYKYNSGGKKFTQVQFVLKTWSGVKVSSFRYTPNI